jgi:hypothetical protein
MQRPLPRPVSSPTQCFFFLLPLCRQQRLSAPLSGHFTRAQKYFFLAVLAEAFSLFPVQSLPLRRAQFSFACRHALSGHVPGAQIFCLLPLSRTAGPVRAKKKNFFVWSPVWCACRIFFLHAASGHFPLPRAQIFCFFGFACRHLCAVRSTAGVCMQEFFCFVLSGHLFSAGRAQFFWMLLLSPRTMLQPFSLCSVISPCMRVRGISDIFFRPVASCSCAHNFFCHTLLQRAQPFCSCDQSLSPTQQGNYFFCHFRAAV